MFDQFAVSGTNQLLIPMSTASVQDWPGIHSSKFGGTRLHLRPKDELTGGYEGAAINVLGRKHYGQDYSKVGEYKPQVRIFPNLSNRTTDLRAPVSHGGVQKLDFVPVQRKARAERLHIVSKDSPHQEDLNSGIKTFTIANKVTTNSYAIEQQLQQKTRVEGLPQLRNQIDVRSLGDKAYKNPEYSVNFYKPGGLIPGATVGDNRQKQVSEKHLTSVRVSGKLTWKEREKLDEAREDKRQVEELDVWEDQTLKEANPNWKDPEKFFDNEDLGKVDPKKDPKKAAPPPKKK